MRPQDPGSRAELWIPLLYAAVAGAWIALSDELLAGVARTQAQQAVWSIAKGFAFVVVTAALLHFLVRGALARERDARRRLAEQEALLRAIADASPDPVFLKDRESRWIFANRATLDVVGKPLDAVVGRTDLEIYPDATVAAALVAADRRVVESERPEIFEERVETPTGVRLFRSAKAPFRDADGRVVGVVGSARDVTEQKRMEDALRTSEERLRLFVEHAPAAIAMLDRSMRYLAASRRWLEDYRIADREVVGRSHYEVFPEIPERWRRIHERCLAGAVERCEEDPFPRADGKVDWVRWEIRPWSDEHGRVGGIILFSEVITTRKEAEARLAAEKERLAVTLRSIGDAVIATDDAGRIALFNPVAERLTGWSAGEAAGRSLQEVLRLVSEEDGRALALDAGLVADATTHALLVARDGTRRPIASSAAPIPDSSGRVAGSVLVLRDQAAERRAADAHHLLEEQLRQAQKLESVGRLAGGVAHDFNNLLTVILSCSESLREQVAAGSFGGAEEVQEIHAAGKRASELTQQLLAFARKQVIAPVSLDLNEVVRGSEKLLRRVLGEDVQLVVSLRPDPWLVRCDRGQIEQVILNLAVNARDAMPGGGILAIETAHASGCADQGEAERRPGEYVRVTVRDTGVGLSSDAKEHLFEPFFTTKPMGRGTGLGLATTYGIVKQSGGCIRIESAPGRGTTVELYFPRDLDVVAAPAAPASSAAGGTERILVVEDDAQVREVTVRALRAGGYDVAWASSPHEALALAAGELARVRLLVTDVIMPGVSGRALADALRARHRALRVLFVSGYTQDVIAERGVLDPGVEFLAKPFTGAALLKRVRSVLDA